MMAVSCKIVKLPKMLLQRRSEAVTPFRLKFRRFGEKTRNVEMFRPIQKDLELGKKPSKMLGIFCTKSKQ
jgi:hypothetical protein